MKFNEYTDKDIVIMTVSDALAGALKKALLVHETVSFAVSGGTTPGPIFDALSAVELAWDRVHVMLTDERWVPEDHARSNAALVRQRLLAGPAAAATFVPFFRADMTAQEAAPEISKALAGDMPLSVVLLGMGEDMHTASLFPGADGLAAAMQKDAPMVCAVSPASQPEPRISLSASALHGALETHLVIYGAAKRVALEKAMTLPDLEAPIGAVIKGGTVHWAA